MKSAKDLTIIAMFSALLIGVQFALSMVAGVELVSIMLGCFSFVFGAKRGVATAVCFSLLRCIIFGAIPTAIVLYLVYYPLFALATSAVGKMKNHAYPAFCVAVVLMTVGFTLLDDFITPLMLGFKAEASWKSYLLASLPVMLLHSSTNAVVSAVMFQPISRLFKRVKLMYFDQSLSDEIL